MQIRPERPADAAVIHALTEAAFEGLPFSGQTEARVIEALRAAGALAISLVAADGDEVLGHVAFSPVSAAGWFALGPVSVWPARQRSGVGQALIREGLQRLRAQGAGGCVLLGNPAYYRRFGFEPDPDLYAGRAPPGAFQRLTLAGPRPAAKVSFHPAFEVA
ncbi:GNAT family N-acetyltransferase [Phenylobacterium sp.]|uniref:GNAT family N-acetyltransferase n=1 Tax=Phenylobacterium sp. TaxID=1871053 RepID=UPI0035B238D5